MKATTICKALALCCAVFCVRLGVLYEVTTVIFHAVRDALPDDYLTETGTLLVLFLSGLVTACVVSFGGYKYIVTMGPRLIPELRGSNEERVSSEPPRPADQPDSPS
jgi:hypothetical protein